MLKHTRGAETPSVVRPESQFGVGLYSRQHTEERYRSAYAQFRDETFSTEARADHEEYCTVNERTVLVVDQICFCRNRNIRCRLCIYDTARLQAQLVWMLLDLLEDTDEVRRLSK